MNYKELSDYIKEKIQQIKDIESFQTVESELNKKLFKRDSKPKNDKSEEDEKIRLAKNAKIKEQTLHKLLTKVYYYKMRTKQLIEDNERLAEENEKLYRIIHELSKDK